MAGGVHVRSRPVDLGVDSEGWEIDRFVALNDVSILVDKNKVGDFD
jgi:hypothetical protein